MKILTNITDLRKEIGVTQIEFAKRIKRSQAWVASIESGRILPSRDMAAKIIEMANRHECNIKYESLRPSKIHRKK